MFTPEKNLNLRDMKFMFLSHGKIDLKEMLIYNKNI